MPYTSREADASTMRSRDAAIRGWYSSTVGVTAALISSRSSMIAIKSNPRHFVLAC
jgi:hypothetical protein